MEEKKENVVLETPEVELEPTQNTVSEEKVDENAPKKTTIGSYLYGIWYNFIDSFRYNPCKLPGILIALPGLFIGFFLGFHSKVTFLVNETIGESDFSGLLMFVLVLMGCINIFNGVTVSSKKNLTSVIISSVCSAAIIICGVLWIQKIFYSKELVDKGIHTLTGGYSMGFSTMMSIISVILAMACSLAGCILAFFKYDRNYKKVKF